MQPQPDLRPMCESGELYILMEDFTYAGLTVPKGFRCDGASVPRYLWHLLPRDGMHRCAALIHDYLYVNHSGYTRKEADFLFKSIMDDYGIVSWRAKLAYMAVRLFGGFFWNN